MEILAKTLLNHEKKKEVEELTLNPSLVQSSQRYSTKLEGELAICQPCL